MRGLVMVLVGLGLVAGLATVAARVTPGPSSRSALDIDVDVPADAAPAEAPTIAEPPVLTGVWEQLPAAPVALSDEHPGAWDGRELLVGDFVAGGAAYDPATRSWRSLPPAPLSPRSATRVVAGDAGLFVYGGFGVGDGPRPHLSDGALLDDSGEWRVLPSPPAAPRWVPAAVWTGREFVVWGGERPGDWIGRRDPHGWVGGSAYDRRAGTWRTLPPAPVADVWTARGLWTGDRMLVWGETASHEPYAAVYVAGEDAWTSLPPPPLASPSDAAAVWTGSEILLWGRPAPGSEDDRTAPPVGARLRPGTTAPEWRPLPLVGLAARDPREVYGLSAVWTPGGMVIHGGYPSPVSLRFDAEASTWARLPPDGPGPRVAAALAWTGREVLLWGGFGTSGPDTALWSWAPAG